MLRFCNNIKINEESEKTKPINVPKHIFNLNIIEYFEKKGFDFENLEMQSMSNETADLFYKEFPI